MHFLRRGARRGPFELWVSIVAILNVVGYFLRPEANPIHDLVAPWDLFWAIDYALAGLLMFVGLCKEKGANIEAAGLLLLIGGLLVQILVFASLGVSTLTGTWLTLVSLSALVALALYRVRLLLWLPVKDER